VLKSTKYVHGRFLIWQREMREEDREEQVIEIEASHGYHQLVSIRRTYTSMG